MTAANHRPVSPLVLVALTGLTAGQTTFASDSLYRFATVTTPTAPTFSGNFNGSANLAGSLIGNYDPVTNAAGTRTITGTLGGNVNAPTNNRIAPVTATATSSGTITSVPTGTFRIVADRTTNSIKLFDLNLNLLGTSAPPQYPVNASITYPNFRTRSPNYTYFFLVPVPVSVGTATISSLAAVQTAISSGTMTPTGANSYSFSLSTPMELRATADLSGTVSNSATASTVTVNGTIVFTGADTATATLTFAQNSTEPIPPSPADPPPTPLPFDLPPPPFASGPNASVLLTLLVTGGSVTVNGNVSAPAGGQRTRISDLAGGGTNADQPDGVIDGSDFVAFINAFALGSPAADLASSVDQLGPDGTIDGNDFITFINDFAIG